MKCAKREVKDDFKVSSLGTRQRCYYQKYRMLERGRFVQIGKENNGLIFDSIESEALAGLLDGDNQQATGKQ